MHKRGRGRCGVPLGFQFLRLMKMKRSGWIWLLALVLPALPALAQAASPLGNVGTARVDKGARSVEFRAGYTADGERRGVDERLQMRQHLDLGLTDWYALRLVSAQDKRQGDGVEHGSITIENRLQLIERREHGFDAGLRLSYVHRDGDKTPHEVDMRLMGMGPLGAAGNWEWRHNTVLEHDIGENSRSGMMLELRSQLTRKMDPPLRWLSKLRAGMELFNDFGRLNALSGYHDQDHQFGPVLKAGLGDGVYIQTGYRAGLSDAAPDHLFKLFVGVGF